MSNPLGELMPMIEFDPPKFKMNEAMTGYESPESSNHSDEIDDYMEDLINELEFDDDDEEAPVT